MGSVGPFGAGAGADASAPPTPAAQNAADCGEDAVRPAPSSVALPNDSAFCHCGPKLALPSPHFDPAGLKWPYQLRILTLLRASNNGPTDPAF